MPPTLERRLVWYTGGSMMAFRRDLGATTLRMDVDCDRSPAERFTGTSGRHSSRTAPSGGFRDVNQEGQMNLGSAVDSGNT